MAPGFAGAEVDDYDSVAALGGRVGDVGDAALAGGAGKARAEVKSDVVEVGIRIGDVGWEDDGLKDGVGGQIDPNEFRPAIGGREGGAIRGCGTACVENPETIGRVNYNALDAD